jgi:hypothetical protein
LGASKSKRSVEVIAQTAETYISFSKRTKKIDIRFLESSKFMGKSLDFLVKILPRDKLKIIRKEFPSDYVVI